MNFEILSIQRFKIGIDFYRRIYSVLKKRNGLLQIKNILTGKIFMDDLNPDNILIASEPMENIQQLQEVILNQECLCDLEDSVDEFKIFDRTFDRTFE